MVTVGVFTDEPIVVQGLSAVLGSNGTFQLIPLVCSPEEVCQRVLESQPQVLLVDFSDRVSFPLLKGLRNRAPECKLLLWVRDVSIQVAHEAFEIGIRGIVRKNLDVELLVRCLKVVSEGELWYERGLMQVLHDAKTVRLTRREAQLLILVGQGLSNKEIATTLFLTEGTIKYYLSRLFKKMGVRDRLELALYGLKMLMQDRAEGLPPATERVAAQGPRSIILEHPLAKTA